MPWSAAMGYGTWPELGPYPDPIEEHASKLKEDIKGFDSFSAYNRDPMPAKTYRILMNSLTTLCDKILRQPTPTQLHESIENVRILLQGVQTTATKTHDSIQEIQKTTATINSTADRISTTTKTYASTAASRPSLLPSSKQRTTVSQISSFRAAQRTIRIRLHSQMTAEVFRTFTATRMKHHIQEAIQRNTNPRMKTLEILTANQMKSGDLTISTATIQDADMLRELAGEWGKEVAEGAVVQIPTYPVVVHGIHSKSIDLSKIEEAKQGIILANNRIVPCTVHKIKRISWISRAHEVKERSSIIIEFTDPYSANAFIERGMVYQDQLHECELYSPESKVRQCFNCQEYGHIGTRCYKPQTCGWCSLPHPTQECMTKDTRDTNGKEQKVCANCKGDHEAWHNHCPKMKAEKEYRRQFKPQKGAVHFVPPNPQEAEPRGRPAGPEDFPTLTRIPQLPATQPAPRTVGRPRTNRSQSPSKSASQPEAMRRRSRSPPNRDENDFITVQNRKRAAALRNTAVLAEIDNNRQAANDVRMYE